MNNLQAVLLIAAMFVASAGLYNPEKLAWPVTISSIMLVFLAVLI